MASIRIQIVWLSAFIVVQFILNGAGQHVVMRPHQGAGSNNDGYVPQDGSTSVVSRVDALQEQYEALAQRLTTEQLELEVAVEQLESVATELQRQFREHVAADRAVEKQFERQLANATRQFARDGATCQQQYLELVSTYRADHQRVDADLRALNAAQIRVQSSLDDVAEQARHVAQISRTRTAALNDSVQQLSDRIALLLPGGRLYSSCKSIKNTDPLASSGQYTIITNTGRLLKNVYCEMGLNGGGYTFIHQADMARLTDVELQAMFTDKSNVLLRVRKTDNTQPFGLLKQLSAYAGSELKLGLSDSSGYTAPVNVNPLGSPYLYCGFIPAALARQRSVQGLQVNGVSVTFSNGDSNPNSYMVLFPNNGERTPSDYAFNVNWDFYNRIVAQLKVNPSGRVIPEDFFMFLETHWGGGGCYIQTDGRPNARGVLGAAIGFR